MLREFLTTHQDVLVERTSEGGRADVSACNEDELRNGVPILLDQIADSLRRSERVSSPAFHTLNRCLDDAIAEAVTAFSPPA